MVTTRITSFLAGAALGAPCARSPILAWKRARNGKRVRHALLLSRAYRVSFEQAEQAYARVRRPVTNSEQTMAGYFTDLLTRARRGELPDARASMIEEMERELFSRAIEMANGNQAKAARWLGVSRTTMREKLVHFGLHVETEQNTSSSAKFPSANP